MKVKDGIVGFVVGDALGVPVEFRPKEVLDKNPITDMMGHGTYNMEKGTWSDDSSMVLATMASICEKNKIDYEDIMQEFSEFINNDKYTQYYTFDYGNTTLNAISNFDAGQPALESGCDGERDNGNGSLMRILPLAFIDGISYETIENVSALTHSHERSRIACVLYVEIAKSMLSNDLEISEHIELACDKIKKYYENSDELIHFEKIFNNDLEDVRSSGYVITTLECVLHCLLYTDNYKDAVLKAVNFGGDTDTAAAICGGLAGIYYGFDAIPIDWIESIPQIESVLSLCENFEAFCDES